MKNFKVTQFTSMAFSALVTAFSTIAAYALLGTAITLVPSPAQASWGQCKWEGGVGAPTNPYCKDEDCLEDGGTALCTEPELRPPYGRGDEQSDDDMFAYGMCDLNGPSIPLIARWCAAEGGTWVITGAATQECRGLSPDYPGVGSASNEGAALEAGHQFATMGGGTCGAELANDSGWGLTDLNDQLCASGGPVYQNGVLLSDMRRQDFSYSSPCNSGVGIKYGKSRQLVCPNRFAMRTKPGGDVHCFAPKSAVCPAMNPVDLVTGAKIQIESDYLSADGLEVKRYYNSQGRFRPKGTGPFVSSLDDYWSASYSSRVTAVNGNPNLGAYLFEENNSIKAFDTNGAEILNEHGGGDVLEDLGASGWKLTRANADVENFDASGRLTSLVTRTGLTTTISYGSNGKISQVANAFGRTLTFAYTGARLALITLPGGGQLTYGYDSKGRPASVTYPDNSSKTYHYEDASNRWHLTGITDEAGNRFATYSYSDSGQVVSEEHAGGADHATFGYGDPKQSSFYTYVTDALGKQRTYLMTRAAGVFKIQAASEYSDRCPSPGGANFDAAGNYSATWDLNGRATGYTYDPARNLETSRTEGYSWGGVVNAATRTITTDWNPNFRVPSEVKLYAGPTATGTPVRRATFAYDSSANLLSSTEYDGSIARTWTYTYDGFGRVLTIDGPRSDVSDLTTLTYYICTTGGECGQIETATNALGQVTTYNAYNAHGQATQITDANGIVVNIAYDARQRLIARCIDGALPACTGGDLMQIEYWPTGLVRKVTEADSSFVIYTYDAAQRLTSVEDSQGNKVSYVLDALGNRTSASSFDPYGTLVRTEQRLFNSLGQLWQQLSVSRSDVEASVLSYDQSGNQTAVTAPSFRTNSIGYDALARVSQVVNPSALTTTISYDPNDNVSSFTDPRGLVTSFSYNGFGSLKTISSPDTGSTTIGYDSAGNVATLTDARGAVQEATYDALSRPVSFSFKTGATTEQTYSLVYDTGVNGKGRLASASDANESIAWTYDGRGRVVSKSQHVGSNQYTVQYGYANGNLTSLTTPTGKVISYGYGNGHLRSISLDGVAILSDIQYEPFGATSGWTWGNGTLAIRNYDLDGRLTLIDSAGLSVYAFHPDGNVAGRSDDTATSIPATAGTTTFTVDPLSNRLASASGAVTRTYSYDAVGSTLSDGTRPFTYYLSGRLKTAKVGSAQATTYLYNALGERVRKSGGAATTEDFVYDEAGHLLGEYDSGGALIQETIWFGDIPVAAVHPSSGGYAIYYVHADQLNTPRRVTTASTNQVVWRWDSDAFGSTPPNNDPDNNGTPFVFNLRFPGQFYDSETQLHYNYLRDYDPASGSYVESDPIGLGGGANTYAYAGGNPINLSDSTGQCFDSVCAACMQDAVFCAEIMGQIIINDADIATGNCASAIFHPSPYLEQIRIGLAIAQTVESLWNAPRLGMRLLGRGGGAHPPGFGPGGMGGKRPGGGPGAGSGAPPGFERVRHHTSPEGLAGIRDQGVINASRGGGVHVETQPFGPASTASQETGAFGRGGYVEFDTPTGVIPTNVGPRNTGVIPTTGPLSLEGRNPTYVKRPWWRFWD